MTIEYENLEKANATFFNEFKKSFAKTLQSGWFILGENVARFENEFSAYCSTAYCSGVASGLDALILSLRAMDIPSGSEIIVPSNTYIATILAILHAGLKPVLVEPDIRTYNIDPSSIEERITRRTKGIMVVHLYGKICDMDPILKICRKYRFHLIEDCAQAHGAKYKGKIAGSFGDAGAFSFYPTKNLGALGDAGAVVTNKKTIQRRIKMLRHYGQKKKYYNELIGMNSRLDELQAGFLSIKLKYLQKIIDHKRKLADLYSANLKEDFIKPVRHPDYYDVFHIYNIRHEQRDEVREYLFKRGVMTDIHYPIPPHRQNALRDILGKHFPISEEIHRTTLSLPISFSHTTAEIETVVDLLNKY